MSDSGSNNNIPPKVEVKSEPTAANASAQAAATAAAANQPPKRVFVPNLVKREKKDVVPEVEQSNNNQGNRNRRQYQPNTDNRGRGRGRQSNLIMTHSVFEAGPAESSKRFGKNDAYSSSSYDRVIGSTSSQPRTNEPSVGERKNKSEAGIFEDVLLEPSDEQNGTYVKLPTVDIKTYKKPEKAMEQFDPIRKLFSDENINNEQLLFLQMVDCLQLSELDEGKIGKIKMYRSGKIELCLNGSDIKFSVSLATDSAYLQDIVSVNVNETETDGELTCLGHVKHKLLFTPKF